MDMVNPMITLPITLIPYVLTDQRILCSEQLLGRALEHYSTALVAAFGTHVDDPIGARDDTVFGGHVDESVSVRRPWKRLV